MSDTARAVEALVRQQGAVPATIAILDGNVHVGLDDSHSFAMTYGCRCHQGVTARFGGHSAQGVSGATTVAGTMVLAHWAGIRILVTGGIGGVHRGADQM